MRKRIMTKMYDGVEATGISKKGKIALGVIVACAIGYIIVFIIKCFTPEKEYISDDSEGTKTNDEEDKASDGTDDEKF